MRDRPVSQRKKTPFQSYYMSQSDSLYPSYSSLHCCFCAPVLPTCPNRCAGCWGDDLCLANQKYLASLDPKTEGFRTVSTTNSLNWQKHPCDSYHLLRSKWLSAWGLAHGVVGLRHLAVHGALPKLGFWCFLHRWHSWRYFIGFPFIKMFTFF